jgi:hypothetical protein
MAPPWEDGPLVRLEARLSHLQHDVLARLASEVIADGWLVGVKARMCRVDALMAEAVPLPSWVLSDVLLSPDLLTHLFAPFELEDHAMASVCSAWREAWQASLRGKHVLMPAAMPLHGLDDFLFGVGNEVDAETTMCASGDGGHFALATSGYNEARRAGRFLIHVWDGASSSMRSMEFHDTPVVLAMSNDELWCSVIGDQEVDATIYRVRLADLEIVRSVGTIRDGDGVVAHLYEWSHWEGASTVNDYEGVGLSPDGNTLVVQAFVSTEDDGHRIVVVALDAHTLRMRYIIPDFNGEIGPAAISGDEIYIGMSYNPRDGTPQCSHVRIRGARSSSCAQLMGSMSATASTSCL